MQNEKLKAAVEAAARKIVNDIETLTRCWIEKDEEDKAVAIVARSFEQQLLAAVASGMEEAGHQLREAEEALRVCLHTIGSNHEEQTSGMKAYNAIRNYQAKYQPKHKMPQRPSIPSLAPAQGTDGLGADEWHAQRASYENRIQLLLQEIAHLKSAPSLPVDEGTKDRLLIAKLAVRFSGFLTKSIRNEVTADDVSKAESVLSEAQDRLEPSPLAAAPKDGGGAVHELAEKIVIRLRDYSSMDFNEDERQDHINDIGDVVEILTCAPACVPAGDGRDKELARVVRLHIADLLRMADIFDANNMARTASETRHAAKELAEALDAAQSSTQQK